MAGKSSAVLINLANDVNVMLLCWISDALSALERQLVAQLGSPVPPLHHRLHLVHQLSYQSSIQLTWRQFKCQLSHLGRVDHTAVLGPNPVKSCLYVVFYNASTGVLNNNSSESKFQCVVGRRCCNIELLWILINSQTWSSSYLIVLLLMFYSLKNIKRALFILKQVQVCTGVAQL